MFAATIDGATLHRTLQAAAAVVEECRLHLREDGLWLRATDPAVVAAVELELSADAFERYEADGDVIGVNLSRLMDVTSLVDGEDLIDLRIEDGTGQLAVESGPLEYTLALIDTASIRAAPDELAGLAFTAEMRMAGSHLDRGIRAAEMVGDQLRLRINGGGTFHLEASGDTDVACLRLGADDVESLDPGEVDSLFSLEYLQEMNRAIPGDELITIECGDDVPALIDYTDGEAGPAVTYLLSPLIRRS